MINKVEVFECPKCARMSRREEEITKCLEKHEVDRIKDEQREIDLVKIGSLKSHLANNLKTTNGEDIARLLIEAAAMIGFDLSFSKCSRNVSYGADRNLFDIAGIFRRINQTLKTGFNTRLNTDLDSLVRDNRPSIGDFMRFIDGIEPRNSCYGETFNATIDIVPDKIQALKILALEQETLVAQNLAFQQRKAVLSNIYVSTRLPVLKITDISYLNTEDMYKEITTQIAELTLSQKQILATLRTREKELREEDNEALSIAPELQYTVDFKRLDELNAILGKKR